MTYLRIAEGDGVFIPIFTLNTDKRVWGKDAQEFKCVTSYVLLVGIPPWVRH